MPDDVITIELMGEPRGKGRPRFVRATGHAYTPAETRKYEDALRYAAGEAMAGRPPLDGPVDLKVNVHLPVPQSWSGKRRREALAGVIWPTKRPDSDNYLKAAEDALNMIVFRDDSQVVHIEVEKRYSDRPRLTIEVRPTPLTILDHKTGEVRETATPLFAEALP